MIRSLPRLVVVPLAAVVLCALGGTKAEASCGDYLHSTLDRGTEAETDLKRASDFPTRPCSGPHCGKRNQSPIPVAPVTPTHSRTNEVFLHVAIEVGAREFGAKFADGPDIHVSSGFPKSIQRPPWQLKLDA